jgi:hypothetical protein
VQRALLLDGELAHHSGWIDVIDAFELADLPLDYRRFFPHLTEADVQQADDAASYDVVVMAGGRWPGTPSSRARFDEIDLAVDLVQQGGLLVLAPQSGWRDSWTGEGDWFVMNRILEELDVDVRIDRNVVIGDLWGDPTDPHVPTFYAYPTPLEFTLGYPYVLSADGDAVAAGSAPTLRVDDDGIQVLLRTYGYGYLWQQLEGAGAIGLVDDALPMAVLAQVGEGYVAVIPRGPLTVAASSGLLSDKPAMDLAAREGNRSWLQALVTLLVELERGDADFEVTQDRDGDDLFSVASSQHEPLDPDGDVFTIGSSISERGLPEAPPAGALLEHPAPARAEPVLRPGWFGEDGLGSLAYGGLPSDPADMEAGLAEAVAHGVDVVMTGADPSRLATLSGEELTAEQAAYAELAAAAEAAGARWFVGDHFNATPGDYPEMIGAHGGAGGVPAPLSEGYWSEVILPMYAAVGEMAAAAPGLAGLHVDLELYSGPVTHHDGWAFSDDTLEAGLARMDDPALADPLRDAPAAERLDLLIDAGALGDYFAALEEAAADLGRRCREAARASAPELELTLYTAGFPNTWFYKGLLRGMGTPEQPVAMLTYEGWADRTTESLQAEGIEFVHLGGTIVSHWLPTDFEESLVALGAGNDGYWYFTWNDFSASNPAPPALHGDSAAYWDAVDAANARLAE